MASMTHNEVISIFKSRINILELLHYQGYNVEDYNNFGISEVNSMHQFKQLDMLLTNEKTGKNCYVKYHSSKNLKNTYVYDYIDDLFHVDNVLNKNDELIIIIKDEPNEPLLKLIANIWEQDGIFINVFNIKRLQFNILKHHLVPPHRVLTNNEAIEIKKQYNIQNDLQIPSISRFSPPAQAIGLRPGELCEITRPSKTSINSKFYRICSS